MLGLLLGVTLGVCDIEILGVIVGVIEIVGVIVGVIEIVGVTVGVTQVPSTPQPSGISQ
jgi:hypothetical protein